MLTLVLIRPGKTDFGRQGRVQGRLDIPLSEEGIQQVDRLAEELRSLDLEVIYGGSGEPAWQTTQRLATALEAKAKQLDDLHNLDHGLWQGMLIDEVKRKQPKVYRQWQEQPESVCPPDGETLVAAQQRVQTTLAKLMKKHKQGRIGLVVSEPMATLVRTHFDHGDLGDMWHAGAERPQWELIEAKPPVAIER